MSVQEITPQLRQQYGIADNVTGVVVTSVKEVSPAGEAHISEGDVISEVQGTEGHQRRRSSAPRSNASRAARSSASTSRRRAAAARPISGYRFIHVPVDVIHPNRDRTNRT